MSNSGTIATLANKISAFSTPTHPLVRVTYEVTSTSIKDEEDPDNQQLEVKRDFRSAVVELLPLDFSFTATDPRFAIDTWAHYSGRCLRDDGPTFYETRLDAELLNRTLQRGVLPVNFVDQFYDAAHPEGLKLIQSDWSLNTPRALRFLNEYPQAYTQLDIFRIERIL
jgi:hypothetical protein